MHIFKHIIARIFYTHKMKIRTYSERPTQLREKYACTEAFTGVFLTGSRFEYGTNGSLCKKSWIYRALMSVPRGKNVSSSCGRHFLLSNKASFRSPGFHSLPFLWQAAIDGKLKSE